MGLPPGDVPPQTLWTIWIALFASVVLYAAIGVYVPFGQEAMATDTVKMLTQVLGFVALTNLGIVFGLKRLFAARLNYPAYCIVRWALCEAVAIFGLVLHVLGADLNVLFAFVAASAFAMVIARPGQSSKEGYDAARADG